MEEGRPQELQGREVELPLRQLFYRKRAYHLAVAQTLTDSGCIEEADRHLDAVGILDLAIEWS